MMKQFLRVKQIADQKFQRSEKTGVLTDELTAAEKRVDLIKESCCACGKKLSACMQRLIPDATDRRNSKKLPEAALAHCMEEWGLCLGESSILGMTLVDYARVQDALAKDLLKYKTHVEDTVVEPLQSILNVDIDKIMKLRKQLFKLTADMDSAKMRYQSALRSNQTASGNGNGPMLAKLQLLREEAEDASSRVEQCRDSLTAEMFNLISREPEMSRLFVRMCKLQLEYHRKAFYMLESVLPELDAQIKCCPYQRVFGVSLEDHLKVTKREIATVIETCVCWLLETAMEEEGLFRIGGSMIKIKKMKSAFDAGLQYLIEEDKDPHNIAGVLKLYLRSLPEPLLTYEYYDEWMKAAMESDHDSRLRALWNVVNSIPESHFKNLRYLIKFLAKLCQNSEVNKMSVQNVSIVIGPNLIWPQVDECALGMNMTATNLHSSIMDTLITYSEWFFPGECEFYVSTPTSPRHIEGLPPPSLSGSQLSLSTAKLSNGDSAVDSMSSSPTNRNSNECSKTYEVLESFWKAIIHQKEALSLSSPKSPSPRVPIRPRKKTAPRAPPSQSKNFITRSLSCGGFQANALAKANNAVRNSQLSQSISHEDLLNADLSDSVFHDNTESKPRATSEIIASTQPQLESVDTRNKTPRPKPPRSNRNGLPPVAERTIKHIERPSVPPPQVPESHAKPTSISSEEVVSKECDKIIELDDISISLHSSESEIYNECQISFMDDTDNEEDASKVFKDAENTKVKEKSVTFCEKVIDINQFKSNKFIYGNESKESTEKKREKKTEKVNIKSPAKATSDYGSEVSGSPENLSNDESSFPKDCHFVGGTPTWFDHYGGDDKRQSSTLWFSGGEEENYYDNPIFESNTNSECQKNASPDDKFRTVIEVGNDKQSYSAKNNTVSGTSIKLRVNSETLNTRL